MSLFCSALDISYLCSGKKGIKMKQLSNITTAQYEIINMLSCINNDEDVKALKAVIVQFLNERLQNEIDKLWEDGTLSDEVVAGWKKEHMRTPYKC